MVSYDCVKALCGKTGHSASQVNQLCRIPTIHNAISVSITGLLLISQCLSINVQCKTVKTIAQLLSFVIGRRRTDSY
jgi:sulfite exporter TauE/SafE